MLKYAIEIVLLDNAANDNMPILESLNTRLDALIILSEDIDKLTELGVNQYIINALINCHKLQSAQIKSYSTILESLCKPN